MKLSSLPNLINGTILILIYIFTVQIPSSQSANILFYFGVSSYSHRISVWPLVKALAEKGHSVTFSTIFQPKPEHVHPKIKEFLPKEFEEQVNALAHFEGFDEFVNIRITDGRFGTIKMASGLPGAGLNVCDLFLSNKVTQDWIKTTKFDLVIIDGLYNECGYGLAYKFGAKTILFGTTSVFHWWHDAFGFPAESSWIPELHVAFPYPMTFGERIISTIMPLFTYYQKVWSYYPKLDAIFKEKFNLPNMPTVAELERQTSLILLSSHFSEEFSRSLPPLIVPVGGIHLNTGKNKDDKNVPTDIAKFMNESGPDGFIDVSFGSAAKISNTPKEIQSIFYTAFKNTKIRFLWKWEDERPKEMPSNVLTAKWMPQQAILSHPKIRAFMTHAGLMGLTEAITNAVPLIMFPLFAEQDYNSYRFDREKRGIRLEISNLTLSDLESALTEIIKNPIYKQNMLKTKKLFEDRPSTPLDTAVWWTEYVLRHDDLHCLKPLSMNQWWFERRLLDVWGFIVGLILVIIFIVLYILKKLFSCLFCSSNQSSSQTSKRDKKVKRN